MDLSQQVIQINEYELSGTSDDYVAAIGRLAERTERDGHRGVIEYRFFVRPGGGRAGATIVYADVDAWKQHHEIAYQWEEMGALQASVRLDRLTLFGPLNDEIEAWLRDAGIEYTHYPEPAAQFTRVSQAEPQPGD